MGADFLKIFARRICLDGDIYARADTAENIAQKRAMLASARALEGDISKSALKDFFTKSGQARLEKAMEDYKKYNSPRACIVDVSQSESRNRMNALLPAATKSSQFVSLSKEHIFTQLEIDFAMGWPVLEGCKYFGLVPKSFKGLSAAERQRLTGNGMCLQQVFSWILYVQSHCVRRDMVCRWIPPLLPSCYPDVQERQKGQRVPRATHVKREQPVLPFA